MDKNNEREVLATKAGDGWFLERKFLSDLAAASLDNLIERAKHAHMCDVDMRINGQNERFEADWIKYMKPVLATKAAEPGQAESAMAAALRKIIEMNRQHAADQYGDANKAETWACVRVAREGLATSPAPSVKQEAVAEVNVLNGMTYTSYSSKLPDGTYKLYLAAPSASQGEVKVPEGFVLASRADLEAIDAAMNHMGDQLNDMDAVEDGDEETATPGFDAIRRLLAAAPSVTDGEVK